MKTSIETPEDFRQLFVPADPSLFFGMSGQLGAEVELYIVRKDSVKNLNGPFYITGMTPNGGELLTPEMFVPGAAQFFTALKEQSCQDAHSFVTEFSGCQIEINSMPFASTDYLVADIGRLIKVARDFASKFDWDLIGAALAPEGIPKVPNELDERYMRFFREMPSSITDIMFRVAALHIHAAAETEEELFGMYNRLVRALPYLRGIGDFTQGMRSHLFETALYPAALPPELHNWEEAFAYYRALGKLEDLKAHWAWVRLSGARTSLNGIPVKPMTVEYRLPDTTTVLAEISRIAEAVKRIVH